MKRTRNLLSTNVYGTLAVVDTRRLSSIRVIENVSAFYTLHVLYLNLNTLVVTKVLDFAMFAEF
jgi:hypothetical protein